MTPSPSDAVLDVTDLLVEFRTDEGWVQAVRGVSYQLPRGEVLGIVGESGSGKSVTSLAVMGLLPGSARVSGSVRFAGTELLGAPEILVPGATFSTVTSSEVSPTRPAVSVTRNVTR